MESQALAEEMAEDLRSRMRESAEVIEAEQLELGPLPAEVIPSEAEVA
jgi:hypothetical protein